MTDVPETRLKHNGKISHAAQRAMALVADLGGSAREQADVAREVEGIPLVYLPHEGKRERERRLKRLAAGKPAM